MAQWSTIDYSSGYSYQPQLQVSSNHDQLRQLDDRHKDMQKLETNIVQLHDIHRELATIVTEQGQIVDSIENSVHHAEHKVTQSVQATRKAVEYQSAARRKKILCGSCVIVLILIAIIVTVIIVTKK